MGVLTIIIFITDMGCLFERIYQIPASPAIVIEGISWHLLSGHIREEITTLLVTSGPRDSSSSWLNKNFIL